MKKLFTFVFFTSLILLNSMIMPAEKSSNSEKITPDLAEIKKDFESYEATKEDNGSETIYHYIHKKNRHFIKCSQTKASEKHEENFLKTSNKVPLLRMLWGISCTYGKGEKKFKGSFMENGRLLTDVRGIYLNRELIKLRMSSLKSEIPKI